jgi:hypothetical protein
MQNLTEQQVRQIVKDEIQNNYRSGAPLVAPHRHNGNDNLKVNQTDIINGVGVMGKINFKSNSTYTLYFSAKNPSRLDLNGFVFDTGAADSSALIVGTAILGNAYYFQPFVPGVSAKEGGAEFPAFNGNPKSDGILAQCSSNLYVQDGGTTTFPHTDQFFIMNALTGPISSPSNYLVTGQLQNLTPTSVDIVITNLKSGWNVSANFIIT